MVLEIFKLKKLHLYSRVTLYSDLLNRDSKIFNSDNVLMAATGKITAAEFVTWKSEPFAPGQHYGLTIRNPPPEGWTKCQGHESSPPSLGLKGGSEQLVEITHISTSDSKVKAKGYTLEWVHSTQCVVQSCEILICHNASRWQSSFIFETMFVNSFKTFSRDRPDLNSSLTFACGTCVLPDTHQGIGRRQDLLPLAG